MENRIEGYMNKQQMEQANYYINSFAEDTIRFWIATRVNGVSSSLADAGNINYLLLKMLIKNRN